MGGYDIRHLDPNSITSFVLASGQKLDLVILKKSYLRTNSKVEFSYIFAFADETRTRFSTSSGYSGGITGLGFEMDRRFDDNTLPFKDTLFGYNLDFECEATEENIDRCLKELENESR